MKNHFAAKHFAPKHYAAGHWTGVGVDTVVVFVGVIGVCVEAVFPTSIAMAIVPTSIGSSVISESTATAEFPGCQHG